MQQFVYRDKIYIAGKMAQVTAYLKELASRYATVREYLDRMTEGL